MIRNNFFDIRVKEAWDNPNDILELLAAHSERGVIFKSISQIENKTKSIQEAVDEFTYFVPLKDDSNIEEDLLHFTAQKEILVESFSKKLEEFSK